MLLSGILTCDGVEKHEVLKVGDLSPLPALGHVGGFEKLPRGGQRDAPGKNSSKAHQAQRVRYFLIRL